MLTDAVLLHLSGAGYAALAFVFWPSNLVWSVLLFDLVCVLWFVTQRYPESACPPVKALNIIAMALGARVTLNAIVIPFIPEGTIVAIHFHRIRGPWGK